MTDDELRTVLADRLAAVRARIAGACARVNRKPDEVTLVAVTKTVSPRVARMMVELGVPDLGESRPQALWRKAAEMKDLPVRWHLVGHLQRNKVERTLPLVHMMHSLDSRRLYEEVRDEADKERRNIPVLFQVNVSREGQKHGFNSTEMGQLDQELEPILELDPEPVRMWLARPRVVGLMGMAAYSEDPEQARPAFRELRKLRDRLRKVWQRLGSELEHLSMGMSGDFEVAIEEGSTIVRIGTTLFEGLEEE